jgi:hypothetical protein
MTYGAASAALFINAASCRADRIEAMAYNVRALDPFDD